MAVLLRTAVAFLFLARIGANGQAIPENPPDGYQPEIVAPVHEAAAKPAVDIESTPQLEPVHDSVLDFAPNERDELLSPASPSFFGLKTFLLGLIVAAALLHFTIKTNRGHPDTNSWGDYFKTDEEDAAEKWKIVRQLDELFSAPLVAETTVRISYSFFIGIMLSGLSHIVASTGRKVMARMGKSFSPLPPQRGIIVLIMGLLLFCLSLYGMPTAEDASFIVLFDMGFGIVTAGLVLLMGSSIQRRRHRRRLQ